RLNVPRKEDVLRFTHVARKYRAERDAAVEWTEAFEGAIRAHSESSEHYEWAQLCAEIGIVIASIALLFSSRKVWGVSLVLGASALAIIGYTWSSTHGEIHHAEEKIAETGKRYEEVHRGSDEKREDERLIHEIEAYYGETAAPEPAVKRPESGHH